MYDKSKVAFIDIETTGLDPERHRPWEIAVIVDDKEWCWQQELSTVDRTLVDEWVRENTRYEADYDPYVALTPQKSMEKLIDLVEGRHLVGACPWFDAQRLHRTILEQTKGLPRLEPWHYHYIDVENLAVGYLQAQGIVVELPWNSRKLSSVLGVPPDAFGQSHTALADARWAKALYERIMVPIKVPYEKCLCGRVSLAASFSVMIDGTAHTAIACGGVARNAD